MSEKVMPGNADVEPPSALGDIGEAGEHGGGVGVEPPGRPEAWRACRSPRDLLMTLAPVKKSLMKLSDEQNPTTLREVPAGVDEEDPVRMESQPAPLLAPRGRQLSSW